MAPQGENLKRKISKIFDRCYLMVMRFMGRQPSRQMTELEIWETDRKAKFYDTQAKKGQK